MKKKAEYEGNLARGAGIVPEQDTPVLAVALLNDIDYLVSGDKHFTLNQKLKELQEISIVTPREMLELMRDM